MATLLAMAYRLRYANEPNSNLEIKLGASQAEQTNLAQVSPFDHEYAALNGEFRYLTAVNFANNIKFTNTYFVIFSACKLLLYKSKKTE